MSKAKPRMLVVGSRGFLGGYVTEAAGAEFEVIEGNRTAASHPSEVKIDVREVGSVRAAFRAARPDVVLLLAALSDIDRCEQFPEEARAVNLHGSEHVVDACASSNARLLFTSTGAVFDGRRHGYSEEDPVSPVSVYGATKAAAEAKVLELDSSIVVRIALALGFAGRRGTNALLDNLKHRWSSGQTVALPVFEQRNPIDAVSLSWFMLDLVKKPGTRGIFHIGSKDSITRYDLGVRLASRMGYPGQVQPQREPTLGRAPRGPDHYLLTDKLGLTSAIPIPTCDQAIERCFDGLAQG